MAHEIKITQILVIFFVKNSKKSQILKTQKNTFFHTFFKKFTKYFSFFKKISAPKCVNLAKNAQKLFFLQNVFFFVLHTFVKIFFTNFFF